MNLRDRKKTDFLVEMDPSRTKYVSKVKDELTKNRRKTDEAQETQVMFEDPGLESPQVALSYNITGEPVPIFPSVNK